MDAFKWEWMVNSDQQHFMIHSTSPCSLHNSWVAVWTWEKIGSKESGLFQFGCDILYVAIISHSFHPEPDLFRVYALFCLLYVDYIRFHAGHVILQGCGKIGKFVFLETRSIELHAVNWFVPTHPISCKGENKIMTTSF